jgi:hypothetical protein
MNLNKLFLCLIISFLIANCESLKVIYARNTTAQAIRKAEAERLAKEKELSPDTSSIINIPTSCKFI